VTAPEWEQGVGVTGVLDAPHDEPGGDAVVGGRESGVFDFGDLGVAASSARTGPRNDTSLFEDQCR
jgi:hypothetical protein